MKKDNVLIRVVAGLWCLTTAILVAPAGAGRLISELGPSPGRVGGDEYWDPRFAYPGVDHMVECVAVDGPKVYFGGWFDKAGASFGSGGGVEVNGIALWDGTSWAALGGGVEGRVYAVAVKGTDVYVGGFFSKAGGVAAKNIARWDGTQWWPLGAGTDRQVNAIVVIGETVYVGGDFGTAGGLSASRVAAWNGTAWSALGGGVDSGVYALAALGSDLVVGGRFTSAGSVSANRIARWSGSSWSDMGAGMSGDSLASVYALAVSGSTLYAGGTFTTAGTAGAANVARWDGASWHAMGAGVTSEGFASEGVVQSLAVLGGRVFVGGAFDTAGGAALRGLAVWDGAVWSAVGGGLVWGEAPGGSVRAMAAGATDLFVGGDFFGAGSLALDRVARWDGGSWHPLGMGVDGEVHAVASIDGEVFIGGSFETAGGVQSPRIAVWDGERMKAIGNGIEGDGSTVAVRAITRYRGALIAAGSFPTAGGVTVNGIASWDGTQWSALEGGVGGSLEQVNALAVYDDVLYVGGQFNSAGGVSTGGLAAWNGSGWSAVDTGIVGASIATVWAMAVDGDRMAVAGYINVLGGGGAGVALFDGVSWTVLGSTDRWQVNALCFHGEDLYAGGGFNTLGGVTSKGIARYDGSGWSALGSGITGTFPQVSAITFRDDELIVGGNFTGVGGVTAANIARFDGTAWSALGSGMDPGWMGKSVNALATTPAGVLAGGSFVSAGAKPSYHLALWTPEPGGTDEHRVWLQVASHASGANQSQWRTDLGLLNPGAVAASARLVFHAATGVLTRTQPVQPGQQLILSDIVGSFGAAAALQPAVTGSAALEVVSDQPLKVTSRTYNLVAADAACYPAGTFGQGYDAFASEQGLTAGASAWLPQLAESAAYRTNIALTNTGTTTAAATVLLLDGAGRSLGGYVADLAPGEYRQEARPFFSKAGQTNLARGYARVTVTRGHGVLASASVIDNLTNDPTTIGMQPTVTAGATATWVQVGSHASGANQSQWRTDLGVLNPGPQAASVQVRFHKATGVRTNTTTVAAGQQAVLVDVVNQVPETGSAGLEVVADRAVVVSSRTYNQVGATAGCYPNGTFGQSYDAFVSARALGPGAVAYLPQLQENAAYRTNIALTNTGTAVASVVVTLRNASGSQVGEYTVELAAGEYRQESRPFATRAGQTALAAGYAEVAVLQGSGVIASASVIDNLTNDPTTIPAM